MLTSSGATPLPKCVAPLSPLIPQLRCQPPLHRLDVDPLARGVVLHLIAADAADAVVARFGVGEVVAADGRRHYPHRPGQGLHPRRGRPLRRPDRIEWRAGARTTSGRQDLYRGRRRHIEHQVQSLGSRGTQIAYPASFVRRKTDACAVQMEPLSPVRRLPDRRSESIAGRRCARAIIFPDGRLDARALS